MDYAARLDAEETTRRYINSRKYDYDVSSTYASPSSSAFRSRSAAKETVEDLCWNFYIINLI